MKTYIAVNNRTKEKRHIKANNFSEARSYVLERLSQRDPWTLWLAVRVRSVTKLVKEIQHEKTKI